MRIKKNDWESRREAERLAADNEKLKADLAYIAMMTDVDIDEPDEEDDANV